jgi:hypothetical protein
MGSRGSVFAVCKFVKPLRQAAVVLDNPGSILFSDENVHTISSRLVQVHNDLIISTNFDVPV